MKEPKVHFRDDWGEVPSYLPLDTWLFTALCGYIRRFTTHDKDKVTCKVCLRKDNR